jgi:Domain of unknown function (DUF6702)
MEESRVLSLLRKTTLFLAATLLSIPLSAHPSHTSFAEIGWSDSGEQLEVSLRVIPEDLEAALANRSSQAVALQDTTEHRALVSAWLADNFVVSSDNFALPVQLVGMDLSYNQTWLYFTVTANPRQPLTLVNKVLLDISPERGQTQLNQVQRLWGPANDRMTFVEPDPQTLWTPGDS